ncbi:alpha/beta hydrolase [Chromobacterium violaceum]|uniref:alpha/beta hydrolase n=1 Tax=Chromobacterium violaceum TaxID=536 RepID=UPI001CE18921|nr:alpha/beta hydrolase [Chromobacterium violaceum]
MTLFINTRASACGGLVADEAFACENTANGMLKPLSPDDFANKISGHDLVLAAHGFNVNQENGIKELALWEGECVLPASHQFIGVLWPGDSCPHVFMDYVYEGIEANHSGNKLAAFINRYADSASSLTLAAHSLGARMALQAARGIGHRINQIILMAAAIENNCLAREYHDVARKIPTTVVASRSDAVLHWAFPAGNLIGEILMHGHPYDQTALGRSGPAPGLPRDVSTDHWQIPDTWNYGHLDYLPDQAFPPNYQGVEKPGSGTPPPGSPNESPWKAAWSAAVLSLKSRKG